MRSKRSAAPDRLRILLIPNPNLIAILSCFRFVETGLAATCEFSLGVLEGHASSCPKCLSADEADALQIFCSNPNLIPIPAFRRMQRG